VPAQHLHRAEGPPRALLLEVEEIVRHDSTAVALRDVGRLVPLLEDPEAQLRILGDAPFRPADLLEQRASHQGHRAVLDDRIAFVAGDHADVEEAPVLRVAHRLERAFAAGAW